MTHIITAIIATKTENEHQPPIFMFIGKLKTTNKIKDHNFMSLAYITHIVFYSYETEKLFYLLEIASTV